MSILSTETRSAVAQALVDEGLITPEQLETIKEESREKGTPMFELLINAGHISDEQLTKATAKVNNVPYVNLSAAKVDTKILSLVSKDIAERYMAVPLGEMKNRIVIAMLAADNLSIIHT